MGESAVNVYIPPDTSFDMICPNYGIIKVLIEVKKQSSANTYVN